MSRNLGKIQKQILEILEEKKRDWYDVSSIIDQIVNGINNEINESPEITKQLVLIVVRRLERLGHIESRIKTSLPITHLDIKTKEIRLIEKIKLKWKNSKENYYIGFKIL